MSERMERTEALGQVAQVVRKYGPELPVRKIAQLSGYSKSPLLWGMLEELVDNGVLVIEESTHPINHRLMYVYSTFEQKVGLE